MALAGSGQIVVMKREGQDGSVYPLHYGSIHIGSGKDCDITIPVKGLAHKQCLITVEKSHATIKNLSGTAPTVVNNKPITTKVLAHGDIISFNTGTFRWDYITQLSSKRKSKGSAGPTFLVKRGRRSIGRRKSETATKKVDPQIRKFKLYSRNSLDALLGSSPKNRQVAVVKPQRRDVEPSLSSTPVSAAPGAPARSRTFVTPSIRRQGKRASSVASPESDLFKVTVTTKRRKINDVEKVDTPVVLDKNKRAALMLLTGKSPLGRTNIKSSPTSKGSPTRKSLSSGPPEHNGAGDMDIRSTPVKQSPGRAKTPRSVIKTTPARGKSTELVRSGASGTKVNYPIPDTTDIRVSRKNTPKCDTPMPKNIQKVPSPAPIKAATPKEDTKAVTSKISRATPARFANNAVVNDHSSKLPVANAKATPKPSPPKSVSKRTASAKVSSAKAKLVSRRSLGRTVKVTPVAASTLKMTPSSLYSVKTASTAKSVKQETIIEETLPVKTSRRKLIVDNAAIGEPASTPKFTGGSAKAAVGTSTLKKKVLKISPKKVLPSKLHSPRTNMVIKPVPKKIMPLSVKTFYKKASPVKIKPKKVLTPRVSSARAASASKPAASQRTIHLNKVGTAKASTPKLNSSAKSSLKVPSIVVSSNESDVVIKYQFKKSPKILSPRIKNPDLKNVTSKKLSPVKQSPNEKTPTKVTPKRKSLRGSPVSSSAEQAEDVPLDKQKTPGKVSPTKPNKAVNSPRNADPTRRTSRTNIVNKSPSSPLRQVYEDITPVLITPDDRILTLKSRPTFTPKRPSPVSRRTPGFRSSLKRQSARLSPGQAMSTPIRGTPVQSTPTEASPRSAKLLRSTNKDAQSVVEVFSPENSLLKSVSRKLSKSTEKASFKSVTFMESSLDTSLELNDFSGFSISGINSRDSSILKSPSASLPTPSPSAKKRKSRASFVIRSLKTVTPKSKTKSTKKSFQKRKSSLKGANHSPKKKSLSIKSTPQIIGNISPIVSPKPNSPRTPDSSSLLDDNIVTTPNLSVLFDMEASTPKETRKSQVRDKIRQFEEQIARPAVAKSGGVSKATRKSECVGKRVEPRKSQLEALNSRSQTEPRYKLPAVEKAALRKSGRSLNNSLDSARNKDKSLDQESNSSDVTDVNAPRPNNEIVITPKSTVKLQPEMLKEKHSTAKKSISRKAMIDHLTESPEIAKELFKSPVKRKLSQSIRLYNSSIAFDDAQDESIASAARDASFELLANSKKSTDRRSRATPKVSQSIRLYHSSIAFDDAQDESIASAARDASFELLTNSKKSTDRRSRATPKVSLEFESVNTLQVPVVSPLENVSPSNTRNQRKSSRNSSEITILEKSFRSPNNSRSYKSPVLKISPKSKPSLKVKSPKNNAGVRKLLKTTKVVKSPKNDLTNVAGVKKLLGTPKPVKSPKNDLTNVAGVKRLLGTPKPVTSPKNDLTNVAGVKKLLGTPKPVKSPRNDLTNVAGVKKLLGTPKPVKSPKNDLTNVAGVKKLLGTPKPVKSPKNDLTNVAGVKKLLGTPKPVKSPKNDLTNVAGVKKLLGTPKPVKSPKNDLTNVAGMKKLLGTPKPVKSPKNDLTNVAGVKKLLGTPKLVKSPKNDLTNVAGVKKILATPKPVRSPKNDLTNVEGVKRVLRTPKVPKSPKNDLTNVLGLKQLLKTPKVPKSPKNDLSNVIGVKRLLKTPRVAKSPKNDLTKVAGVKKMFQSPRTKQKSPKNSLDNVSGVADLFEPCPVGNQNSVSENLFDSLVGRSPVKTYTKTVTTFTTKSSSKNRTSEISITTDKTVEMSSGNYNKSQQKYTEASTLVMADDAENKSKTAERSRRQVTIDRTNFSLEVSKVQLSAKENKNKQLTTNMSILGQSTPAKLRRVASNMSEINIKQLSPILFVPKVETSADNSQASSSSSRGRKKAVVKKVAVKKIPTAQKKGRGRKSVSIRDEEQAVETVQLKEPVRKRTLRKDAGETTANRDEPIVKTEKLTRSGSNRASVQRHIEVPQVKRGRGRKANEAVVVSGEISASVAGAVSEKTNVDESMDKKKKVTFASDVDVFKGRDDKPAVKSRSTRSGKSTVEPAAEVEELAIPKPKGRAKAAAAKTTKAAKKSPKKKTNKVKEEEITPESVKSIAGKGSKRASVEEISPIVVKRTRRGANNETPAKDSPKVEKKSNTKSTKKTAKKVAKVTSVKPAAQKAETPVKKAAPKTKIAAKATKVTVKTATLKKAVKKVTEDKKKSPAPKVTRSTRQRK